MSNIKKFSSIICLTAIFTISISAEARTEEILVRDDSASALTCSSSGDKNKGHGNDPYIEFEMNIDSIGQAELSGDFDLDNPGESLDKQLNIVANSGTVLWTTLGDEQKQQIKAELYKHICLAANIFAD